MSQIRSYSVGDGDMFYINHGSDNFTIIDCCLDKNTKDHILAQVSALAKKKGITRFISTHPDEDHLQGLIELDEKIRIVNFYCVKNAATKPAESSDFIKYREFRDSEKAFHIFKGCNRKWMNQSDEVRKTSDIQILWPNTANEEFKKALKDAADGKSPNNISAVIKYSLEGGATFLWMGDLETRFMEAIEADIDLPKVDILFAPHHGRDSGRVPDSMLKKMQPKVIIVGEAPSEYLHYYPDYNTITQNSAGDIHFECNEGNVHIFTMNDYKVDFLDDEKWSLDGFHYIGTLNL
jgi:beta-lactamase superfamily II metal-dependent hydrolase